jgi:hypothetical protein
MVFMEIIGFYDEIHTKHINTLCAKCSVIVYQKL